MLDTGHLFEMNILYTENTLQNNALLSNCREHLKGIELKPDRNREVINSTPGGPTSSIQVKTLKKESQCYQSIQSISENGFNL